jgi:ABC-type antimicrobial peptide transport system permease subunit
LHDGHILGGLVTGSQGSSYYLMFDPLSYAMAATFFAAVVAASILPPGRRATRISPREAMQQE